MTGLDPIGRVEVKRIIQRLHERGKTVLFNSHILADVPSCAPTSRSCASGRVVWTGTVAEALPRPADAGGVLHEGRDGVNQPGPSPSTRLRRPSATGYCRDRPLRPGHDRGGLWLASISLGQEGRMMSDFGLVAVTLFGLIVAVFVAAGLVHKEVEKRTVFILFSKPVEPRRVHRGKFFGLAGTMLVIVGMGLFLFALVWLVTGTPRAWLLAAVAMIYAAAARRHGGDDPVLDVASAILASVLGICVFVAGQLSHNVLSLTRIGHKRRQEALSWVIYVVIPNLTAVDVKAAVVGEGPSAGG